MIKKIGIVIKPQAEKNRLDEALLPLLAWLREHSLAYAFTREAAAYLEAEQPSLSLEEMIKQVDLILALGGDGTLLALARVTAPLALPVLAVNLGGLGFITEVKVVEMLPTLELILAGEYQTDKRMMLEVNQLEDGRIVNRCNGLNEVVINKPEISRLIHLDVYVNKSYMTSYAADGLIISTPTGSTAYSLSAGGPIVHPQMEAFIITPICPHTITNRPVIVDSGKNLKVVNSSPDKKLNLTIDGQVSFVLEPKNEVIVKKAPHFLNLVVSPYKDYFSVLREKLKWSGRT